MKQKIETSKDLRDCMFKLFSCLSFIYIL